jgi:hypothetical protein
MPFDYGLRLNNRQRIANSRAKPIEPNKNQSVDGAEGLFLRSGSPQNVDLLPQRPNFRLERCPRPKQICDHPNNEPEKISHPAAASPIVDQLLVRFEFATGTAQRLLTLQPIHSPNRLTILSIEGFRRLVALPSAPIATGWSDPCREGFAPSQELCLSTAHDFSSLRPGLGFRYTQGVFEQD